MKQILTSTIGMQQGSLMLFSDFEKGGLMWAGLGEREVRATVEFPEAFTDVPMVHAAIGLWDLDHKHNLRADLTTTQICAQSFEIVFRTWGDTRIARVRVDWMAMGAARQDDDIWHV